MTEKQQDGVRGIRREGAEQDAVLRALGAAFGEEKRYGGQRAARAESAEMGQLRGERPAVRTCLDFSRSSEEARWLGWKRTQG